MNYHHTDEQGEQLIPASGYTSEATFRQENDNLFGRCWNFSGMADDIPEPGDYQCVQAGNYPLLVVRDLNGQIRAFHNICRHRGMAFLVKDAAMQNVGSNAPTMAGVTSWMDA